MRAALSPRLYYGWVVVGVVFTAMLLASGIRTLPGPLMVPLEREFGWDRASISMAVSANLLLFGLVGPWVGRLMDTRGPRTMLLLGLTLSALSVLAVPVIGQIWQLWLLWGVGVGIGLGGSTGVIVAAVASRWFTRRRGLVVGILSAAMSAGQFVFLPLVMGIIVFSGWRTAVFLIGGAVLLVALPLVAVLMRDNPSDVGQTIEGADADAQGRPAWQALPAVHRNVSAFRTTDFWLLSASYFVCGFTTLGLIGTHLIPHAIDHGFPEAATATIMGLMGFMNFVGTTGAGWLSDRCDKRKLLGAIYGLRGLSLLALPFIGDIPTLGVFAVVYGLDWIATVPPTVSLCADLYGKERVGNVYGWVFLSHQVGAAAAAYAGGIAHEVLGGYGLAFFGAGLLAIIAMGLALRVSKPVARPTAEMAGATA